MTSLERLSYPVRIEFDDLVQSGYFALVAALETYKPESGSFSTWLMYYLQSAFAETAGYKTNQGRMENAALSLDEPFGDEEQKSCRVDFILDNTAQKAMESIEEREYQKQLREALETALGELPEKQGKCCGYDILKSRPLEKLGKVWGLARNGCDRWSKRVCVLSDNQRRLRI